MRSSFMRSDLWVHFAIFGAAMLVALVSDGGYPRSCNDRSQLAAVEALVDRRTFAIDASLFPTGDKVRIDGHYYSTRPPVPTVLLAGLYQTLQWTIGCSASADPARFGYALTVASSGLAYALAVCCIFALGGRLGLSRGRQLWLTASFGLGTLALPYAGAVNTHILLLAVALAIYLLLPRFQESCEPQRWHILGLGALAGLGYTLDLGAGPLLLFCTAGLVLFRCRHATWLAVFALGALPWLALHHAINYSIGGTWKPYSAVPDYFQYPGSGFDAHNLTGVWNKHTPTTFVIYAARMMLHRYGFLNCNILVVLAVVGGAILVRRRAPEAPEVLFSGLWFASTWLLYAYGSSNNAGKCLSIRWFVPLLAPAFYTVAVGLRRLPGMRQPCSILGGWGIAAGLCMWWQGPWRTHEVNFLWSFLPLALLHCWIARRRAQRARVPSASSALGRITQPGGSRAA